MFTTNMMGGMVNVFWYPLYPLYITMAINRYVAIVLGQGESGMGCGIVVYTFVFPDVYKRVFTTRRAIILVGIDFSIGCLIAGPFFHPCCYNVFSPPYYSWGAMQNSQGSEIFTFVDFSLTGLVG
jgi:hypothetical protein